MRGVWGVAPATLLDFDALLSVFTSLYVNICDLKYFLIIIINFSHVFLSFFVSFGSLTPPPAGTVTCHPLATSLKAMREGMGAYI